MRIEVGTQFAVHWKGHEQCYNERIYKVVSVIRNCICHDPMCFVNGTPETPRKAHLHIKAIIIQSPRESDKNGFSWFNNIDPENLTDPNDPDNYCLEIVNNIGVQMTLF